MRNTKSQTLLLLLWFSVWIAKMSFFRYSKETGDMRYGNVRISPTWNKRFRGKLSNYVHFTLFVEFPGKTYAYQSNRHFTKDPFYDAVENFPRKKYNAMLWSLLMEAKAHPERFRPI